MNHFEIKQQKINIDDFSEEKYQHEQKAITENAKSIEMVRLSGNSYSIAFWEQFSQFLKKMQNLKGLDINDCFVGRKKEEIPQSLTLLTLPLFGYQIQKIDLSNNAISINGSKALMPFLSQATYLQVLIINNCGLGIDGTTNICQAIAIGAPNLEVWAMARNRVEDKGAEQLGLALKQLKKLKELVIYQNFIREKGVHSVIIGLQASAAGFEFLDIQDNYVKHESAKELAVLIQTAKNLRGLNLSDCNIEEGDNDIIIEALKAAKHKFEKFGYNYNELNSKQAKQLCDIVMNDNLKRFDIKGNEFASSTQKYYKDNEKQFGLNKVLSAFESDDEEDEDEQQENQKQIEQDQFNKLFSELKL